MPSVPASVLDTPREARHTAGGYFHFKPVRVNDLAFGVKLRTHPAKYIIPSGIME